MPEFGTIAEICDIYPTNGWKRWEDEDKNFLRIAKNNTMRIHRSSYQTATTRDLFAKALPIRIARSSYFVLALFNDNRSLLNFLGDDGLLRCSEFLDEQWIGNHKPLLLGLPMLKLIAREYINPDTSKLANIPFVKLLNFEAKEGWVSEWPDVKDNNLRRKIDCLIQTK